MNDKKAKDYLLMQIDIKKRIKELEIVLDKKLL